MIILLFLLWLIFNGGANTELLIFGVLCAGLVYFFMCRFMGYSPKTDLRILLNIPWLFVYSADLIYEIIKASLDVMEVSFNPGLKPDPVIVEFHSGFEGGIRNVLLANSITLTPGTITVFQEGDFFVVHCLRREYAEGIETSSFVRLLKRLH